MIVTLIFGASALNEAASSAVFNLLFFAIILVFAISFLGAFEITLPSRFVNKMDEKSDKSGLLGIFFMAFTLRSEEHTSELQSLMRISYAVFCLKKKTQI